MFSWEEDSCELQGKGGGVWGHPNAQALTRVLMAALPRGIPLHAPALAQPPLGPGEFRQSAATHAAERLAAEC